MKAVELKIGGIKCDNTDCDYKDMTVSVEDYKDWVDKPCPRCGSNLLTKKDYKATKRLMRFAKVVNKLIPEKCLKEENQVSGVISMNGSGKMNIKIDDKQL
jgi:predicted nucleic-acid-binding Zn-ribbon protein